MILREIERQGRQGAGRPRKNGEEIAVHDTPQFTPCQEALRDAGLSTDLAKRWQTMAYVKEKELEEYFGKRRDKGELPMSGDVYKMGQAVKKALARQNLIEQGEEQVEGTENFQLITSSMADLNQHIEPESIDIIIAE